MTWIVFVPDGGAARLCPSRPEVHSAVAEMSRHSSRIRIVALHDPLLALEDADPSLAVEIAALLQSPLFSERA